MDARKLLAIVAALCIATTAWTDVTAPSLVTDEALFWFDASALTETTGTELDSWADVRGGSYPTFTTYTTTKPQVIEISRPLCVGPIGTR